jgi:ketosteroid isomerase-like protein
MTSTQSEIRAFLDNRSEAISTGDLDRLMSFYSPDIVYFDIVPPLQYVGSVALRERFRTGSMALRAPSARKSTT